MTPLPSQRTLVAPHPWLRRHGSGIAALAPLLTGGLAWAAGVKMDVDPIKAFRELGAPVATVVLLAAALAWLVLVYLPRQAAEQEQQRQALLESHAQDRAAFLEAVQHLTGRLDNIEAKVDQIHAAQQAATEWTDRTPPAHPPAIPRPR